MKLEYIVEIDNIAVKDYILYLGLGQNFNKKVKLYGNIFINDVLSKNYFILHIGDKLTLEVFEKANDEIVSSHLPIDIVYCDQYLMVINKPHDISSQPSKKHYEDNIISRVKGYLESKGIDTNIHLVNRLDFQTSGLMVVSLNGTIHHLLTNNVDRMYLCVCDGKFLENLKVEIKIDRLENNNILRCVSDNGKSAKTNVCGLAYDATSDTSLVKCKLYTGRTHQIRLTMKHIGHSLVGDKLYNDKYVNKESNQRLMLHSYYVEFIHPITKEKMVFTSIDDFINQTNFDINTINKEELCQI